MKILDRKTIKPGKFTSDPGLDNLPTLKVALEKAERARKFFEEHPLPERLQRK
ncbi:hypothetical protein [Dyadobacter beijingensis]|uniref:hypothetical protein n=1 Tax=Dyadobacter beijingensis TaxID=365489 RepID=UPI00035D5D28|nr:hypothetical protein [Dyadobacter beijingensis]